MVAKDNKTTSAMYYVFSFWLNNCPNEPKTNENLVMYLYVFGFWSHALPILKKKTVGQW